MKNKSSNSKGENGPDLTFRELRKNWEFAACVELQRQTWGEHFEECVPPGILLVNQKMGGITAGAFDREGKLIGVVFGLTGVKRGRLAHWSHMLAVRSEARCLGIGRRLKLYQRDLLLRIGVDIVYWTYDPLVARNAHLNLNRLGADIDEYVLNMYGDDLGSVLSRGIGTDRFIVVWHISQERVRQAIAEPGQKDESGFEESPIVNAQAQKDGTLLPTFDDLPRLPGVRVEIPFDILAIQEKSPDAAAQWRKNTREVFSFYLDQGYKVTTFYRDTRSDRCFYFLIK